MQCILYYTAKKSWQALLFGGVDKNCFLKKVDGLKFNDN